MLKFLSCALVLFSSTFLGFLKAADFEKREKVLKGFLSDFGFIKNEITELKTPILSIIKKLADSKSETVIFYRAVSEKAQKNKDVPLSEIFCGEAENITQYFPLKERDIDVLRCLAVSFGKSDIDGQNAMLLQAEKNLNLCLDDAVCEKNKNARLCKNLGFYLGILLVVIFF